MQNRLTVCIALHLNLMIKIRKKTKKTKTGEQQPLIDAVKGHKYVQLVIDSDLHDTIAGIIFILS